MIAILILSLLLFILLILATILQIFAEEILKRLCYSCLSKEQAQNTIFWIEKTCSLAAWCVGTYLFFTLFGLGFTIFAGIIILIVTWLKNY